MCTYVEVEFIVFENKNNFEIFIVIFFQHLLKLQIGMFG